MRAFDAALHRRGGATAWLCAVACALWVAAPPAQAGLFDDDEARKAILELRARMAQAEEQAKARNVALSATLSANFATELAASNAQMLEQITALRRSLLDLNNQLELLRADMARLRGADEQLQRDLADVQKRQKDLGQAMDERLRKLEPIRVSLDGREFSADPDERKSYDDAVAAMRSGDFDKAAAALAAFQRRWPNSGYGDSVRFWLGNAQYARRDHKAAIDTFRTFVTTAPEHARAPEAMLAMANSQAEMKDTKAARKTLDDLLKAYPKSEAAAAGKERLASLR